MEKTYKLCFDSPVGWLEISGSEKIIQAVTFVNKPGKPNRCIPDLVLRCRDQLKEYFDGIRSVFDLPLDLQGTEFQKKVWEIVLSIPYGRTKTYGEIAKQLGSLKKVRAVGMANGKNKLAIIVPCHRVIGSKNQLTGYGGGLMIKDWLLKHERKYSGQVSQLEIFY